MVTKVLSWLKFFIKRFKILNKNVNYIFKPNDTQFLNLMMAKTLYKIMAEVLHPTILGF